MELEPTSECGMCLHSLLKEWIEKSPDAAQDALHRAFIMFAFKLENQYAFLDALYGLGALQKAQWDLTQESSPAPQLLSAVRHAISTSLSSRRMKELIVALEWSQNLSVLQDILKWAEDVGDKCMTETMSALSVTDLAPQRAARTLYSLLSDRPVSQRDREICLDGWSVSAATVGRDCNKIIVGFKSGHIRIYNYIDLKCDTVLQYYSQPSRVCCLQSIHSCTELLAGYADGNICSWDIKSGTLKQKVSVWNTSGKNFPHRMRWWNSKLTVVTDEKRVEVWQYMSSNLTLLGAWDIDIPGWCVRRIESDENYIMLQEFHSIHVYFPNGQLQRRIESQFYIEGMAYQNGKLITGSRDGVMRVWDVETGDCLKEVRGLGNNINSVEVQKHVVLSGSHSGVVTLWDMAKILEANISTPDAPGNASSSAVQPSIKQLDISKNEGEKWRYLLFGRNFVLGRISSGFRVIDFL